MGTSHPGSGAGTPLALTGTPGTGKSAIGRTLARGRPVVELGDLAVREGLGRRHGRSVEVDLPALARWVARRPGLPDRTVVVGHLAHLLPIRDVFVLRCRPDVLVARLRSARRGTAADRRENYLAEALDVVLLEAVRLGRTVWEVDTTGRTVGSVAAEVGRILARRPPARFGRVDWLADRRIAAHLLDPPG
jgi:broad-specificity NMP kinase